MKRILLITALIFLLAACAAPDSSPEAAAVVAQTAVSTATPPPTAPPQASPTSPPPIGETIMVDIELFKMPDLTVNVGDTVVWTNKDAIIHSVTSGTPDNPGGVLDSEFFDQGEQFSYTFTTAGEFPYFCRRHEFMQGTIIVK